MTDIWNKEIVLTDEDKQRLGITDEQNRAWAPIARAGLRESVSIGAQNIYDKK